MGKLLGESQGAFLSLGIGDPFVLAVPLAEVQPTTPPLALSSRFLTPVLGIKSAKAFNSS